MHEDALGPVNPDERVEVSVILRPRRQLSEQDLTARAGQPMTREEFAASYGADPSDIAGVEAFARDHGLQVIQTSPERRTVVLGGRAADMEAAFGVKLSQVRMADGTQVRAADREPQLPPQLAASVVGVFGLDTHPAARPRDQK